MTLLERIHANAACAVVACDEARVPDSLFCREHVADMWANRLERQPDGTFLAYRRFAARDETGWNAA